jgi:hypothetical protein
MFKRPSAFLLSQLLVLLLLIALVTPPVAPQDSNNQTNRPRKGFPQRTGTGKMVLRIDTDLVSVDVTAMNSLGQPVKKTTTGGTSNSTQTVLSSRFHSFKSRNAKVSHVRSQSSLHLIYREA